MTYFTVSIFCLQVISKKNACFEHAENATLIAKILAEVPNKSETGCWFFFFLSLSLRFFFLTPQLLYYLKDSRRETPKMKMLLYFITTASIDLTTLGHLSQFHVLFVLRNYSRGCRRRARAKLCLCSECRVKMETNPVGNIHGRSCTEDRKHQCLSLIL